MVISLNLYVGLTQEFLKGKWGIYTYLNPVCDERVCSEYGIPGLENSKILKGRFWLVTFSDKSHRSEYIN